MLKALSSSHRYLKCVCVRARESVSVSRLSVFAFLVLGEKKIQRLFVHARDYVPCASVRVRDLCSRLHTEIEKTQLYVCVCLCVCVCVCVCVCLPVHTYFTRILRDLHPQSMMGIKAGAETNSV